MKDQRRVYDFSVELILTNVREIHMILLTLYIVLHADDMISFKS